MRFIIILLCFALAIALSSSRRIYNLEKRIEDTNYRGSVLSYSHRVNGPKSLFPTARQMISHPSENTTLDESFTDFLFDVIAEKFKSTIKTGVPSLGTPTMDPLKLDRTKLEPIIGGDPFDITLKNVRIKGLSHFQIRDLTPKLSELRFRISISFPNLATECHYAVNGTMYDVFDVQGTGFGNLQYHDVLIRTTVNMELNNGTLKIVSAEPPFIDFARATITLKASDGRTTSGGNALVNELGPVLFWMLADQVVEEIDAHTAVYLNEAIKTFKLPANFKPVVTWLMKRNSPPVNPLLKRLFPNSSLGTIFHTVSSLKHQFNIPFVFESLKSNFRSNLLRRFL